MNVIGIVKKAPWRIITKIGGVALVTTSAALGAFETDAKVQKAIKIVASKIVKDKGLN